MIYTLIIGLFIGVLAKFLMPGRDPGGFIMTIILGIAGSIFAGWGGELLGFYSKGEPVSFIASVIGAMILLFIYRQISGRRSKS